ncbi:MAG TPA: hypothetical protein VG929_03290 [Actinomycetota bacterium]|nr:hypothetical protein [Actinomycetota bacterium]
MTEPGQRLAPSVPLALLSVVVVVVAGESFGYVRALVAVAMFAVLVSFGLRQLRGIANSPPEPELADVSEFGLKYVCSMCGLELRVEVAARDRAPTHCMEPMKLVRVGGKPPLTTV